MPPVFRSLEDISTRYTVFEKDQVLTHAQLNSVAGYADDQTRLTRVQLLGVGIVSGLRVSVAAGKVTVTRGVGITTDGDIVALGADTVFDRVRPYDATFPAYAPLYTNGDVTKAMVPVQELVREGATDANAKPFANVGNLPTLTAVALVETYVTDHDICSGDDCDNLGQDAITTLRILVLDDAAAIARLRPAIATASDAFATLPEIVAERPRIPAGLSSPAELVKLYRGACGSIRNELARALPLLAQNAGAFLGDAIAPNTSDRWLKLLQKYDAAFGAADGRIQYYYDFLRDLVDIYGALRDCHLDDTSLLAPSFDGFPKHLMLGVVGSSDDTNRTGFYPSPLIGGARDETARAIFLARTLDRLIARFNVPKDDDAPIRVTPSAFVDRELSERAIPFYYGADDGREVHFVWSYRASRRGTERSTYGYDSAVWAAQGSATADPLGAQIGRFPFLRVEGHVGWRVDAAVAELERQIAARNLPFDVVAVQIGTDPGKVVRKPPRVTDLHYVHTLVRRDVAQRLAETKDYATTFTDRVVSAVDAKAIVDASSDTDGVSVRLKASQQGAAIRGSAAAAVAKLDVPYSTYVADRASWKTDVGATLATSGQLKRDLTSIVKTDFATPIDTLISSTLVEWLPRLDDIIQLRDDAKAQRLLFTKFAETHPHVEHFGGVTRGGTFVLLHDVSGVVVGDMMLPYLCPDEPEDLVEPPAADPKVRPAIVKDEGVSILPSRRGDFEKFFDTQWTKLQPQIDQRIDLQSKYLDVLKESVNVVRTTTPTRTTGLLSDSYLNSLTDRMTTTSKEIDDLNAKMNQATTPAQKAALQTQLDQRAEVLGQMVEQTAVLVATAEPDVSAGTATDAALKAAGDSVAKIKGTSAAATTTQRVQSAVSSTTSPNVRVAINTRLGLG